MILQYDAICDCLYANIELNQNAHTCNVTFTYFLLVFNNLVFVIL